MKCVPPSLIHPCFPCVSRAGADDGGEDDDAVAIDINDMDWGSNSEGEIGGGVSSVGLSAEAMEVLATSPVTERKHVASAAGGKSLAGAGAKLIAGNTRTGPTIPPPLFTAANTAAPTTRGSRNQRTSPFNLKACSACKKGRASAIKCRVDRRHWEDPDWTDPPSRPWVMPEGFVDWLAKEDRGPMGEQPGSPTNAATAAAAAAVMAVAVGGNKTAGPRSPRVESASSLLDRMLGAAALPAPAPAPVVPAPIPAQRVAPGAPVIGGSGIKRPRCLAQGCNNAVARDKAFCSEDCVVDAQKLAVQALVAFHRRKEQMAAASAGPQKVNANGSAAVTATGGAVAGEHGAGTAAAAAPSASGGGGAEGVGSGGGAAAEPSKWTAEDEQGFTKGLEAVRGRSAQTAAQRFRHKLMDRFRELFVEGMTELGVDAVDVAVLSGVLAWDLEHELNAFSKSDRGVYKEKAQSLRFNIKFAKNPELFKVRGKAKAGVPFCHCYEYRS